jgi:hypothetical protein
MISLHHHVSAFAKRLAPVVALGAVAIIAACSNGNDSGGGCSTSVGPLPVLLYPAPNSTGITAGLEFVAVYKLGGAGGYVNLVPEGGGPTLTGAQFVTAPLPLPSPSATAPAGSIINASAVTPPLQTGVVYDVDFVHNSQPPCGPQQPSGKIGSFTVAQ